MPEWATCTCLIGEDEYYRMTALRDSRRLRTAGVGLVVFGALIGAMGIVMMVSEFSASALGIAAAGALLVAMGAYVLVTGRTIGGSATHGGQARAYLLRHGAAGDPLCYQQTVVIGPDGVTITYGTVGAHPQQVVTKAFPWSEWKAARRSADAVLIERDTHQGGLSDLFGFNYLLRMAERDEFDDAFLPAGSLVGLTAQEVVDRAQTMIARHRGK